MEPGKHFNQYRGKLIQAAPYLSNLSIDYPDFEMAKMELTLSIGLIQRSETH